MSHIGKRYRIEQSFASPDGGVLVSGSGDGRIGEILSTVQDLRRCFEPSQRRAGEVIEAYRREIAELYGLKAELELDERRDRVDQARDRDAPALRGRRWRHAAGGRRARRRHRGDRGRDDHHPRRRRGDRVARDHASRRRGCDGEQRLRRRDPRPHRRALRGLQFPGPHRPAHHQDRRRAEVRRGAAGPDDRGLGRPRCLQGARRRAAARARPGERALLNGPRLADDVGHVTQDDIDALFN